MVESYLVTAVFEDFSDRQTLFADKINADAAYRIYRDCVDIINVYMIDNRTGEIIAEHKDKNYDNCLTWRVGAL